LSCTAIDRDVAEKIGMLGGLAASGDLKNNQLEEFKRHASLLVAMPQVTRIWAFSKDGSVLAAIPEGSQKVQTGAAIDSVFSGRNFVSKVTGDGLRNARTMIAVPVFDSANVIFGVAAEMRLEHFSQLFAGVGLDPTWPAAVVDRNGRYVARSLDAETKVGQSAKPELLDAAQGLENSGTFENVTWERTAVINAFHRSSLTDWTSVVAVPTAELLSPLHSAVGLSVTGGAAILAITLLLASAMASRISEPVRDLRRYASALSGGKHHRKEAYHIAELDEVRDALDSAMAKNGRLAAIVQSSGDAILSVDLDGTIRTWNSGAEELFGYSADEIVGEPKSTIVPEQQRAEFDEQRETILSGESIRTDTIRRKKDGTLVPVSLNAAPVRRADGKIIAISSIIHDITEAKATEEHLHFLMRELAHRSKNQLAIIQSIAGQTVRSAESMESFLNDFRARLQGMAVSHDLLVGQNWRGAPLGELIVRQLGVFGGNGNDRFSIAGPAISLSATGAEAIGLALHELATNSVKYGALSVPEGRIAVNWRVKTNRSSKQQLTLEWLEEGGPPITQAPRRKGFGSRILETMVADSVSGKSTLKYRLEGVYWRLECDLKS
jgi:PAS domain S-box-containing protein